MYTNRVEWKQQQPLFCSMLIVISWRGEHASHCLRLSSFNRNAVSSVLPVSSEFHARIHTLLQTMEHRDVARLKSPTVTGKIMNELDLRKDRPAQGLPRLYLFIFHPSASRSSLPLTAGINSSINGSLATTLLPALRDRKETWRRRESGSLISGYSIFLLSRSTILESGTGPSIT